MIERYSRPEMSDLWSVQSRWGFVLDVEKAVAAAQASMRLIPRAASAAIQKNGKFDVDEILENEKVTKHDVIAFVQSVAKHVGEYGSYVHYGLTSSDVLDTATSLQVRAALGLLDKELYKLSRTLEKLSKKHKATLCAGRTHGIQAEPMSLGFKLAGYWAELERSRERLAQAADEISIVKISGAVGQYSVFDPGLEKKVGRTLGLRPEDVATQVIPRDRLAQVFMQLGGLGGFFERLSIELRHLQRTEVSEVIEGFTPGQKGSSAMPHKKNPISAENLTGIARLLRSYTLPALENIALWHERDISHSSVERVILPDAFIAADYAASRMNKLLEGLYINEDRMLKNMTLTQGQVFSSHVLVELVNKGAKREEAYEAVQRLSHSLKPNDQLRNAILKDTWMKDYISAKDVDRIFSGKLHTRHVNEVLKRLETKPTGKIPVKSAAKG